MVLSLFLICASCSLSPPRKPTPHLHEPNFSWFRQRSSVLTVSGHRFCWCSSFRFQVWAWRKPIGSLLSPPEPSLLRLNQAHQAIMGNTVAEVAVSIYRRLSKLWFLLGSPKYFISRNQKGTMFLTTTNITVLSSLFFFCALQCCACPSGSWNLLGCVHHGRDQGSLWRPGSVSQHPNTPTEAFCPKPCL